MLYIVLYLASIVIANITVTIYGPSVSIINAFLFIGLDLTARDALHERWQHKHLWLKMFALIVAGSALSWLLNRNAGPIAIASLVAFLCAGVVDAVVYHGLRKHSRLVKVNGSNVLSAAVDSLVFPTLAFGGIMPLITLGQFAAKVLGGLVWSFVLRGGGDVLQRSSDRISTAR